MFQKYIAALLVALSLFLPAQDAFARGHHYGHSYHSHSYHHRSYSAHTGSHHVRGYYRRNGTYVRPHMAGNPGSGNHWHLNRDGSDTLTRPNGTTMTVPQVPN